MRLRFGQTLKPTKIVVDGEEWDLPAMDSKAMLQDLETFKAACRRLDEMRPQLLEQHPDQWAGVGKDGVLFLAQSIEDAKAMVQEQGIRPCEYQWTYLDPDPPSMLL